LALPITAGQVSQVLMGLTDSAMVGHVGRVPLAASAFAVGVWIGLAAGLACAAVLLAVRLARATARPAAGAG
jgi:MATE family multidrug resistance protein